MVEVVGTAPTSVMVITKFVYRRSWQANTITIKAFEGDSIKIMKLNIMLNFQFLLHDNGLDIEQQMLMSIQQGTPF